MALPHIVYKTREDNSYDTDVLPVDNDQGPVFDDELLYVQSLRFLPIRAPSCATSGKPQLIRRLPSCVVKRICMKRLPNCAVSSRR